jgi:hypothetical protein
MKLDAYVAQIIVATDFDHFTTSDVRSAYFALNTSKSLDSAKVSRFIYSQLLKLVKKGWLEKSVSNKRGLTRFQKTKKFDSNEITSIAPIKVTHSPNINKNRRTDALLAKLNHYKAELLLNIGESEAYKELYSEVPELIDEIQPLFNKGRDNNTRILGKIKAVEGLLEHHMPAENF